MLLHFEFYRVRLDGRRIGGEKVTFGSSTMELAISHAQSMLENNTFSFGKANLCLIKDQDGGLIREVWYQCPLCLDPGKGTNRRRHTRSHLSVCHICNAV
jgi:hypothetical protein